jgi:hypothetical protein
MTFMEAVALVGVAAQADWGAESVQEKVIVPVKPLGTVSATVALAGEPCATGIVDTAGVSVNSEPAVVDAALQLLAS